jgi:hypothetical protein
MSTLQRPTGNIQKFGSDGDFRQSNKGVNNMKKRILAVFMVCAMLIASVPYVQAAEFYAPNESEIYQINSQFPLEQYNIRMRVSALSAPLRQWPGSGATLATLPRDTHVLLLDFQRDPVTLMWWDQVRVLTGPHAGRVGFVLSTQLSLHPW